jgi:hypothetical protein
MENPFFSLQQFTTEFILGRKESLLNKTVSEYIIGIRTMEKPTPDPPIIWKYENNAEIAGW